MAAADTDKQKLFEQLKAKGASDVEAAKFAGVKAPETKPNPKVEVNPAAAAAESTPKQPRSISVPSSMSTSRAQRIIFGVMLGATALTVVGDVLSGKASATDAIPRRMAAGTIAGIMLMILAVPLPKIASSLAAVIGIAALFVNPNGQKVLDAISKIGGNTTTTTGSGGPSAKPNRPE